LHTKLTSTVEVKQSMFFACMFLYVDCERFKLLIHLLHSLFLLVIWQNSWSVVSCDGQIRTSLSHNVNKKLSWWWQTCVTHL